MKKIENLRTKTAESSPETSFTNDAALQNYESTTCSKFEDFIDVHVEELSGTKERRFNLKGGHTALSKLKSLLRKLRIDLEEKLQNCLNKLCYKLKKNILMKGSSIA